MQDFNFHEKPFDFFSKKPTVAISLVKSEISIEDRFLFTLLDGLLPQKLSVVTFTDFPPGKVANCKVTQIKGSAVFLIHIFLSFDVGDLTH